MLSRVPVARVQDWQEIVGMYERDNVHLADAAHLMIQGVKYTMCGRLMARL